MSTHDANLAALECPLRLVAARNPVSWDVSVRPSDYPSQKGIAGKARYIDAGDGAVEADKGPVVS